MSSINSSYSDLTSKEYKESSLQDLSVPDDIWMQIVEMCSLRDRSALASTCKGMTELERKVKKHYSEVWATGTAPANIVFVDIKESHSSCTHRLTFQSDFDNRTEMKHTGGRHICTIEGAMPVDAARQFMKTILHNAITDFMHIGMDELKSLKSKHNMRDKTSPKRTDSQSPIESATTIRPTYIKVHCKTS